MARTFDGTNDEIRVSIGNCNITGAITMVVVFKRNSTVYNGLMALHTSGGTATYAMEIQANPQNTVDFTGKLDATIGAIVSADGYVLLACDKAAGTTTPRAHKYVYGTNAWTHSNFGSTLADQASVAGGTVRFGEWQDVDDFAGDIAIAAIYNTQLSDAQIEMLAHDLDAWYALQPVGLWIFDQGSEAYNLVDLTGGGANQSTITGTTVSTVAPNGPHYSGRPLFISQTAAAIAAVPKRPTIIQQAVNRAANW